MAGPGKNIGNLLEEGAKELKENVPNLADGAGVAAFVKTFWPEIDNGLALVIGGAIALYSASEGKKKLTDGSGKKN